MAKATPGIAMKTEAELDRVRIRIREIAADRDRFAEQLADLRERDALSRRGAEHALDVLSRRDAELSTLTERILAGETLEPVDLSAPIRDTEAQLSLTNQALAVLSESLARDELRKWLLESEPILEVVADILPKLMSAFDQVEAALRDAHEALRAFDKAEAIAGGGASSARFLDIRSRYQAEYLGGLFRRWRSMFVDDEPNLTRLDRWHEDVVDLLASDPWLASTPAGKVAAQLGKTRLERRHDERNGVQKREASEQGRILRRVGVGAAAPREEIPSPDWDRT